MAQSSQLSSIAPYAQWMARPVEAVAADLESFSVLLKRWQRVQNLVSRETLDSLWTRHFADSLQILKLTNAADVLFLDLGSGGGFPALPLAIALKGSPARFVLVEPNSRKVSFLRTVAREIGLAVTVEGVRSDQIDSRETLAVDVITSRALASLPDLCGMLAPFFRPKTRALLHKGREHVEELAESRAQWDYDVLLTSSDTSEDGVLIELRNLRSKTVR
ncbi:16S rRNA (guanine(527)-N(7))-methyltransferase RsmG [Devosia sp.]|uniref:16S rRNA (guanine(527)-N(7))-methyltransferase RsmG n=1 Tax=Devosia sp. TaxID=1871048 RepID=UPI00326378A5